MHEAPEIPNYGKAGRGIRLEPGMTLAIEPMVIQGKPNILQLDDGWTIITEDGSLAAHYENTIFNYRKWTRTIDNSIKLVYNVWVNIRINQKTIKTIDLSIV